MESPFKADILRGRVALVTGGSSGIGFEIARQLGLHGARVAVTGRRGDVLAAAVAALQADGVEAAGFQGDVRNATACEGWIAELGKRWPGPAGEASLDVLVNCAAGNFLATAEELSQNGFKTVMEIDTVGTFTMSRAAFPALRRSTMAHGASVVNISATLQYGATWWQAHASAAKSAVDSLTRSLALEWGEFNIRVNGVAPGPIEGTAGMAKLAPGARDVVTVSIPLRNQMGRKWDIAMACVYLSCSAASFVSGDVLVVDGANWLWKPQLVERGQVSRASRGVEGQSRAVGTAAAEGAKPRSRL